MAKYGFIGTGLMGNAMAFNLIQAGNELVVYNRDASKCENLVQAGAQQVGSALEVIAAADITFCMVSDPQAAMSVCFSPHGVIQGIAPGKSYIDMSTVDPQTAQKIAISVQARGGQYLEAPVSGSLQPAKDGELVIIAAGDQSLWEQAQPAFAVMGKKSLFLGDVGAAASMKLAVNMMMGSMMTVFTEALTLVQKCDINAEQLLDVLQSGALSCPMFSSKGAAILAENFTPNFPLKHMQKDLRLAVQLGDEKQLPMASVATANEIFKRACQQELSELDMCAVMKTLANQVTASR
ncbi:MAG: 3-hydroxyisobutyrate dehydrogenase [Desulfobacteraceae bacterium 4572_35.1]|nr:MAG: 3-hydroxyisobutyrate dehydrogenase [Desulfobacteraceae bacterium 4572_35.1]